MSDLAAVLVGVGIGLVIVIVALWSQRDAVRLAWRERRGEQSGKDAQAQGAPAAASGRAKRRAGELRYRRPAIAASLLAALGSAFVAIQTGDDTMRVVNIAVAVTSTVGCARLLSIHADADASDS